MSFVYVSAGKADRAVGQSYGRQPVGSGCQVSGGDSATHLSRSVNTVLHESLMTSIVSLLIYAELTQQLMPTLNKRKTGRNSKESNPKTGE